MPDCCTGVGVCEAVILFLMQTEESLQISRGVFPELGSAYLPFTLYLSKHRLTDHFCLADEIQTCIYH